MSLGGLGGLGVSWECAKDLWGVPVGFLHGLMWGSWGRLGPGWESHAAWRVACDSSCCLAGFLGESWGPVGVRTSDELL